jgi:hypothetical protein
MNWRDLLDRLKEPSSFAGYAMIVFIIFQMIGRPLDVDADTLSKMAAAIFQNLDLTIGAVLSLIAVFKKEGGTQPPAE